MAETITPTEPMPLTTQSDLVNPLRKVADAMTPAPRTCSPSSTAIEAALVMRDADCGMIPVVEAGRPVGLLTDRDLAMALPERDGNLSKATVGDLMSGPVITVEAETSLESAMERLGQEGVRRLLVVGSDGSLAGVLSWTDLVPHLSERGLGRIVARIIENR